MLSRLGFLRVVVLLMASTGFDDVERETALQFHAGSAENGAQRARSASLFADHLSDIAGRNVKTEDGGILVGQNFDLDRGGIVHEGSRDLRHQGLHFGDSKVAIR
jgi:hypothetical protein